MQMIDRREGPEAVEADAEGVGGWVCLLVVLAADLMVNVSSEQSYSQVDGIGCQLLWQTLLGEGYEQTMAKHEGTDVDQYAMTELISILQHCQNLFITLDLVEVEFVFIKRFGHVHLLRHRGGSLQGKQAGFVLGHKTELPWHDATAKHVAGQRIVSDYGRLSTSLEL